MLRGFELFFEVTEFEVQGTEMFIEGVFLFV